MEPHTVVAIPASQRHLTDSFVIHKALANPKKSQELTEVAKEIVHTETSALMRKHNNVQRDEIAIGLWGMKFVFM
jgi:hypothetical protein